jgi:anti-sigma regulatory factor (Ser/Thr protein kinase)
MPDRITAVLSDNGPGIPNVEKAMQEGWSTAPDNIRALGFGAGMGLPNIRKYSDSLNIDPAVGNGTTLTITVLVNPAQH